MKKLTKDYRDAVGQHALNTEKTQLILNELSVFKTEIRYTYEENEYLIGFKLEETNDSWAIEYVIPSPTVDELNAMEAIALSKLQFLDNEKNSQSVRFQYEENIFDVKFSKNSDGEIKRGFFIPYLN